MQYIGCRLLSNTLRAKRSVCAEMIVLYSSPKLSETRTAAAKLDLPSAAYGHELLRWREAGPKILCFPTQNVQWEIASVQ